MTDYRFSNQLGKSIAVIISGHIINLIASESVPENATEEAIKARHEIDQIAKIAKGIDFLSEDEVKHIRSAIVESLKSSQNKNTYSADVFLQTLGESVEQLLPTILARATSIDRVLKPFLLHLLAQIGTLANQTGGYVERYRIAHVSLEGWHESNGGWSSDNAKGALRDELQGHFQQIVERLSTVSLEQSLDGNGPLWLDEILATHLDELGATDTAKTIREKAAKLATGSNSVAERLYLWAPSMEGDTFSVPKGFKALARAVWLAIVRPRLEREAAKPPALVRAVHAPVVEILSRASRDVEKNGQRRLTYGDEVARIVLDGAALADGALSALMIERGIKLFRSVTAHKVLRHQIFTAHKQALDNAADPRVIRINGGFSAYAADHLGLTSKRQAEEVRAIVEAEHATELRLPTGAFTRLLTRTVTPSKRGQSGQLELLIGTFLLPTYVDKLRTMGAGLEARLARRLIPVLDLPPLVGRSNEQGAQASLSMLVVAHLRDNAAELVKHDGVRIDADEWARMADSAGVLRPQIQLLRDRWTQDGDDGPALLRLVEPDRYTLGETHAAALAFIVEGGRKELDGAAAGKKSAARRGAKVRRLAGKGRAK